MKMSKFFALTLMAASFSSFAGEEAAMDPKKKEMMEQWMKYSTPGAPHQLLASQAGKWKYTSKMWESAESKPEESTGTSTMKMILGGRFLYQEVKGKAMGRPFDGIGITGYNNLTEKYESTWMDSMSTGVMHGEGTYDASTKTLKDSGEYTCPASKDKTQKYRSEWRMIDANNSTFTMWGPDMLSGQEFKMMEMTYRRIK